MPLRHREQDLRVQHFGSYTSTIGPTTYITDCTEGFRRVCDDFEGTKINGKWSPPTNDFQLLEVFTHYPKITAVSPGGYTWVNSPVQTQFTGWDPRNVGYPALTGLDRSNMAWEILSKTNPSKPHVSVPTAIGELKDLPDLVRGYGDDILRKLKLGTYRGLRSAKLNAAAIRFVKANAGRSAPKLAGDYLAWRFAVRPMISDLLKLCRFMKAVDYRVNELMRLRTGRPIRKRCRISESHGTRIDNPWNYIVESRVGGGCNMVLWAEHEHVAWGTCTWKLQDGSQLPYMGYGEIEHFARQLAAGYTWHEALATAWALCPWSWFADWFANTGDIIAATNNSVGLTWGDICYMRESSTDVKTGAVTGDPWILAGLSTPRYSLTWTRKERYVCAPVVPFPFPKLPLLTQGQWSILAALAAQKAG